VRPVALRKRVSCYSVAASSRAWMRVGIEGPIPSEVKIIRIPIGMVDDAEATTKSRSEDIVMACWGTDGEAGRCLC
jgi:hypothetical protein